MPSICPQVSWTGVSKVILGSKSWSRRTLLEQLKPPPFKIIAADIDEGAIKAESPQELVMSIGLAKASAVIRRPNVLESEGNVDKVNEGRVLLICGDALVVHKGRILGKPTDRDEARAILRSYADAPATTVSSIVVVDVQKRVYWAGVDEAEVYFHSISDFAVERVIDDGAMQSAGALRIEHSDIQPFIDCIVGDISAVMGFSQPLLVSLVKDVLNEESKGTPLP